MDVLVSHLTENWAMWVVSVTLVVAAVIDGLYLKVPNKITYPLIVRPCGFCLGRACTSAVTA